MKTKRKTIVGIAVATALTAAVATAVYAHGGYGPGYGPMAGPGMMGGYGQMMGAGMMGGHGHMMGGPGMMGGRMGGPGMMQGGPGAFAEQHLENFKAQLSITVEQEPAWNAFADAMRGHQQFMRDRHQAMAGGNQDGGFTDHFAQMQAGMAQMQTVAKAAQDLYATLTHEQQARADALHFGGRNR